MSQNAGPIARSGGYDEIAVPTTPADIAPVASLKGESFRADIQALRGLAVVIVVLYHAGFPFFQSGFLGVDIFFTISGFLITGIVQRALEARTFRFSEFYARRARRILPAAALVLLATTLASAWLLTATQYQEYLSQLVGASSFTANISAWRQTGYFATDAAFRPLLHMWSLAIEEQYYMLLPLFLWMLPLRLRLPAVAVVTLGSLLLCFYVAERTPSAAFFMLPMRAWELGVGSFGAFIASHPGVRHGAAKLLPLGLIALIATPFTPLVGPDPGANALGACVSTLVVLLAGSEVLASNMVVRGFAVVGDFSYSLYLVHWPLFVFAHVVTLSKELPAGVSTAIILLSFVLAFGMFKVIEEPCRHSRLKGLKLAALCASAFAVIIATGYALAPPRRTLQTARSLLAPVGGLPPSICKADQLVFNGGCRQPGAGDVLLWGDSYSMHLVPALTATLDGPLEEASLGHCSPLLDYAALPSPNERAFSIGCMGFTQSVLNYIRRTASIRTVVISASYDRTLEAAGGGAIARVGGVVRDAPLGLAPTLNAQRRTIEAIRAMGRRVVVISPTPPSPLDLGQCWERTAEHRLIVGLHGDCRLRRADDPEAWLAYDQLLAGFEREADVPVIRLTQALCDETGCRTQLGGQPLFKDTGHLTLIGSLYVGHRLDLGHTAERVAR